MDNKLIALSSLKDGERAIVKIIDISGAEKIRLNNLGLIENTTITALYRSFLGEPLAYLIRGAVIALRFDTTDNIYVQRIR